MFLFSVLVGKSFCLESVKTGNSPGFTLISATLEHYKELEYVSGAAVMQMNRHMTVSFAKGDFKKTE